MKLCKVVGRVAAWAMLGETNFHFLQKMGRGDWNQEFFWCGPVTIIFVSKQVIGCVCSEDKLLRMLFNTNEWLIMMAIRILRPDYYCIRHVAVIINVVSQWSILGMWVVNTRAGCVQASVSMTYLTSFPLPTPPKWAQRLVRATSRYES